MATTSEQEILGLNPELQDVSRQRKLAELLMASGMQQPQGQMISGQYVKPSWAQQLNPLANILAGQAVGERADTKQNELAAALRGKQQQVMQAYAQAKTPQEKFAIGTSEFAPPQLKAAAYEMLKPQKVGEGETISQMNMGTGAYQPILKGAEKYRAPTSVDMGTLGTMLIYPDGKREIVQKGKEGPAGQVVETENGPMLVNTRTGQAQPIMAGGQAIAGGKPLTESQAKATAFQSQMIGAENNIKQLEAKGFNPASLQSQAALKVAGSPLNIAASPETQQYKQAQEQWAEAYLRFKTGAAATEGEVQRNIKTFFPQFGDKPAQIAQKADARRQAEQDIGFAAGMGAGRGAKPINLQTNLPQAPKKVVNFNDLP
jgi:hypothetical protein